ncbi:His Kinase A (phospho-acceptor) domain-containing protein [Enterococcus malodoratus]|uniref:sensor histidine kinase n=1 Tax=Enterococcus malodoratus TaxID=71451 RepID=UPI0008C933D3|nr:HAMP domain-containing sensor histidine kinase [Enterococcus malodoratus]SET52315.1 His Kinase A (phospho-acceptor) domain-containing protein [Enterococcus malodoratus]
MKKLRNSIVRSFVLYFILLTFIISIVDNFFSNYLDVITDEKLFLFFLASPFVIDILLITCFSILFFRSIDKKVMRQVDKNAEDKSLLFANIAHDLKTPLTSIAGFSKALYQGVVKTEDEKVEINRIIYNKTIQANELLDLLFQYSKISSSSFELICKSNDIVYLLRQALVDNYDLLDKREMDLILEIPDEQIFIDCDASEIKRVFSNIIVNACKHNGKKTKLRVRMEKKSDKYVLTFADSGSEIPFSKREQIFEPFISESQVEREFQGNGLGLAISKAILDKHGFTIALKKSKKGFTKEFEIIVPY